MKRVAVTGLGAITPLGNSVPEFWGNILAGKSGAGPITKFDASKFKTQFACEVKDFDITQYVDRKEARKYDLFTQYAIAAADEAVKDSGLDFEAMPQQDRFDVGVIWASGNGGIGTFEEQLKEFHSGDGTPRFNPFFIPKMIVDIAAGVLSIRYGLHGPNYATVSACASSNTAIISAFDTIRLGKAKVMIAGGSEAAITQSSIGGFNASHALSKNNDDPQRASRPFDAHRDGFVAGEGAGALILEEWDHAVSRGATIYAEIAGGDMAADAYHLTGTPADGLGAALGMRKALADAGLQPSDIDYINAHGTSTPYNDKGETKAIKRVFADGAYKLAVSSSKSMTGHMLGATGAVESIVCALAIRDSIVPPTINYTTPDPDCDLDYVPNKARSMEVKAALNNSLGFGGHNTTLCFTRTV